MSKSILDELEKIVDDAYNREALNASVHGEIPASSLSVKDLDLDRSAIRPSTSLFEVISSWKSLVASIKKHQAFLDCVGALGNAFVQMEEIEHSNYRHLKTLVNLLSHTVENRKRDDSTGCRFVTLLEVLLSYGPNWKPSQKVSQYWVRLMQRVPVDVAPVNFRRKAYRVLVSLSWVPSTKGLLGACSFEEHKLVSDYEKAPPAVQSLVARIREQPLPRHDSMNQMLDRLKDETGVCVAITSEKEGAGKTVLAAQVASHPSIQRVFSVAWLNLEDHDELTYKKYVGYLRSVCRQILILHEWPECVERFEEKALRRLREEDCMIAAKEKMSDLILKSDENVLLVLDGVTDSSLISWFRFGERQSVIVTTLEPDLNIVDWTVELDPMSEDEAIDLFLTEAGLPSTHILGSTCEVRTLVKQCEYNPLALRSAGRWFQLKYTTAGEIAGIEEILHDMEDLLNAQKELEAESGDEPEPANLQFDILSYMMGPACSMDGSPSALFIMCFAALVVVFPSKAPLDAVLLLWEQLFRTEPLAIAELKKFGSDTDKKRREHAWFVAEGMVHMGVIHVTVKTKRPWVVIHHKEYKAFAMLMAREMDLRETFEETVCEWNKAFVKAYLTQRIKSGSDHVDDNSWEYAIEHLPSHMLRGKMFTTANAILGEENFFRARIEALGWKRAAEIQIDDCLNLHLEQEKFSEETPEKLNDLSSPFAKTAKLIKSMGKASGSDFVDEVCASLYRIGFVLSENSYYEEGLTYFREAQNLLPQSQQLRATILFGAAWTHLALNEGGKALKKAKTSQVVMEESMDVHVLYFETLRIFGAALAAEFEYEHAQEFFKETIARAKENADSNKIEVGVLLSLQAKVLYLMRELDGAKSVSSECIKWKRDIGETSTDLAFAYGILGDIHLNQRQRNSARDCYENALEILDDLEYDTDASDYVLLTAKLRFLRGDVERSQEALSCARESILRSPIIFMDKSAYDLRCIARVYHATGQLDPALSVLGEARDLTEGRNSSLERASCLFDLGMCLIDAGRIEEGLKNLEKTLEIQVLKLGESLQVVETLKSMGNVHLKRNAYNDALMIFKKVLQLLEKIAPDDVDAIAGALYSIGEIYDLKGEHSAAGANFKECMDVLKRDRSDDHPDVAKALQRLGVVAASLGAYKGARRYFERALEIRRMNFDETQLAETKHSMGVLERKCGELDRATELLTDALQLRKKHSDPDATGETMLQIGYVLCLKRAYREAAKTYAEALEVLDSDSDLWGSVILALGHAKLALYSDHEAHDLFDQAYSVRLSTYGKRDLRAGNAIRCRGIVQYLLKEDTEAMNDLAEYIHICEDCDGEATESAEYATAVMLLGSIHKASGKVDQAKILWTVAMQLCEEHANIQASVPSLHTLVSQQLKNADIPVVGSHIDPDCETLLRTNLFIEE